jgi:large subunit ribosomal protein L25
MSEIVSITAEARERAGKGAARSTRRTGRVPAVIYGNKESPLTISLDPKEVDTVTSKRGFLARPLDINLGGKPHRVLPRDIQRDPVTDKPVHLDFMRVNKGTRIRVEVPVQFVRDELSPGLKRGGVLNVVRRQIELYCTVDTIPEKLDVSLEGLDIGDSVHISKVALPQGVKPTIARDFTIASIAVPSAAKAAAEEARAAAEAAAAAGTVEGAAPAEGAAAAPGAAAPAAGGAAPAAGAKGAAPGAPAAAGGKGAAPAAAGGKAPAGGDAGGGKKKG